MRLLFLSDLHLGLRRQSNYTAESSVRREEESRKVLARLFDTPHDLAICAGDFFDRFSNPETTILEALPYAARFGYILAGNHDSSQRVDTKSSLDVLQAAGGMERVVVKEPRQVLVRDHAQRPAVHLFFVPHQLNQTQFVEALLASRDDANHIRDRLPRLLITHCSYACPFESPSSALNLPRPLAEELLASFHFILLGHEHTPRDDFMGRLRVIGSHFPTAFDNLTDKRHLLFDTDTGLWLSVCHWRQDTHTYRGDSLRMIPDRQFYEFTDQPEASLVTHLFVAGALAVRSTYQQELASSQKMAIGAGLERLPQTIAKELEQTPELLALWHELLEGINA